MYLYEYKHPSGSDLNQLFWSIPTRTHDWLWAKASYLWVALDIRPSFGRLAKDSPEMRNDTFDVFSAPLYVDENLVWSWR